MTKYNASTLTTWMYFYRRQSWRLTYDPDFESAKNRAKHRLTILEDGEYKTDSDFARAWDGPNDAWICMIQDLLPRGLRLRLRRP